MHDCRADILVLLDFCQECRCSNFLKCQWDSIIFVLFFFNKYEFTKFSFKKYKPVSASDFVSLISSSRIPLGHRVPHFIANCYRDPVILSCTFFSPCSEKMFLGSQQCAPPPCQPHWGALGQEQVNDNHSNS